MGKVKLVLKDGAEVVADLEDVRVGVVHGYYNAEPDIRAQVIDDLETWLWIFCISEKEFTALVDGVDAVELSEEELTRVRDLVWVEANGDAYSWVDIAEINYIPD